jgi:hypothetical protein
MKKIFLITILFFANYINAQHCGFDGSSIIVVNVHSQNDMYNIPNLRISIVDKNGIHLINYEKETMYFRQNLSFPFLKSDYGLVVSSGLDMNNLYLKIESPYVKSNTIKVKLYNNDKYPLCGNYDNENYSNRNLYANRVYKPIDVIFSNY